MKAARLLLFVLALLLDMGDPLQPEAEDFETLDEAVHGGRCLVRLLREASPTPPPLAAPPTAPRHALRRPPVRPSVARLRKTPPPPGDPASESDDH